MEHRQEVCARHGEDGWKHGGQYQVLVDFCHVTVYPYKIVKADIVSISITRIAVNNSNNFLIL